MSLERPKASNKQSYRCPDRNSVFHDGHHEKRNSKAFLAANEVRLLAYRRDGKWLSAPRRILDCSVGTSFFVQLLPYLFRG
jgi:hypothetical protein